MSSLYQTITKEILPGVKVDGNEYRLVQAKICPDVWIGLSVFVGESYVSDETCVVVSLRAPVRQQMDLFKHTLPLIVKGKLINTQNPAEKSQLSFWQGHHKKHFIIKEYQDKEDTGIIIMETSQKKEVLRLTSREIKSLVNVCIVAGLGRTDFSNWERGFVPKEIQPWGESNAT